MKKDNTQRKEMITFTQCVMGFGTASVLAGAIYVGSFALNRPAEADVRPVETTQELNQFGATGDERGTRISIDEAKKVVIENNYEFSDDVNSFSVTVKDGNLVMSHSKKFIFNQKISWSGADMKNPPKKLTYEFVVNGKKITKTQKLGEVARVNGDTYETGGNMKVSAKGISGSL